ncbi:MAG TPA: hypothetical protein VIQ11_13365 [Mycobacterium sp.]
MGVLGRAAATAGCVALLGGCATPAQPPQATPASTPDPRASSHFSIVWSDAAGLDLLSAEGTYVRASVESLSLAAGNGDRAAAYPGFWPSLADPARDYVDHFFDMGPDDALFGIQRFEVVDVAGDQRRMTVGVCSFERQLGVQSRHQQTAEPDGRYRFDRQGSYYWALTVDKTGDIRPPADQRGRDTYPQAAVFGSWRTVEWSRPDAGATNPCRDRPTPGVDPGAWPALMPGSAPYIADAPPSAPSYPGWSNDTL